MLAKQAKCQAISMIQHFLIIPINIIAYHDKQKKWMILWNPKEMRSTKIKPKQYTEFTLPVKWKSSE